MSDKLKEAFKSYLQYPTQEETDEFLSVHELKSENKTEIHDNCYLPLNGSQNYQRCLFAKTKTGFMMYKSDSINPLNKSIVDFHANYSINKSKLKEIVEDPQEKFLKQSQQIKDQQSDLIFTKNQSPVYQYYQNNSITESNLPQFMSNNIVVNDQWDQIWARSDKTLIVARQSRFFSPMLSIKINGQVNQWVPNLKYAKEHDIVLKGTDSDFILIKARSRKVIARPGFGIMEINNKEYEQGKPKSQNSTFRHGYCDFIDYLVKPFEIFYLGNDRDFPKALDVRQREIRVNSRLYSPSPDQLKNEVQLQAVNFMSVGRIGKDLLVGSFQTFKCKNEKISGTALFVMGRDLKPYKVTGFSTISFFFNVHYWEKYDLIMGYSFLNNRVHLVSNAFPDRLVHYLNIGFGYSEGVLDMQADDKNDIFYVVSSKKIQAVSMFKINQLIQTLK